MLSAGQSLGPYEIREFIGRGGMGDVYLARDPRLGRDLAVKVLPPHAVEDDVAVERFMREARTASALNHPNVITIYEIGEAESGRFIAMELVRGETLRALVGRSLPLEQVAQIGTQAARALGVAHTAGIVHRDVKPENVMLRGDGYVKVLDFGLARLFTTANGHNSVPRDATRTGIAVGTLRYMSPEQACAEPVTSATDVFSLGLMLYELATGAHPFSASSDIALASAILTATARRPSEVNPAIPPSFDALIVSMLDKDPQRRPSAAMVEAALLALGKQDDAAPNAFVPTSMEARRIVGRQREKVALRDAWSSADQRRGLLICVSGEPGIGKTALVEEFLGDVAGAPHPPRIARGRCSERLAGSDAYLPILEALDSLFHAHDGGAVASLMKRFAPTWYLQVAPSSADDSSEARALVNVQANSQERMKRELSTFIDELCKLGLVVLFLDDLHWSDLSTIDVLAYLAARLGTMRLLILTTVRPAELLLTKHPFAQLKLDFQARGLCREIPLDFLSSSEVDDFVAREFPGHELPPDFARMIHAKTEGSPLFVTDLLRYLRTQGTLSNVDSAWRLAVPLSSVAHSLPESIRGMIHRKIDQLVEADKRLLAAASVQGYQFDTAIVARIVALDPAEIEERLESLEHVYGFVTRAEEVSLPSRAFSVRYHFVHVLYQNALFASLPPSRRASLSALTAEALLAEYGPARTQIAVELAELFEAARDTARAVEYLLLATEAAARVFANQEAVALSRRGLALLVQLPESDARDELELGLCATQGVALGALHNMAAAEVGKAHSRAYDLWKRLGARPNLFHVAGSLWFHYVVCGQLDIGLAIGDELLAMSQATGDRAMNVAANNCLGITLHHLGNHRRAADCFARGLEQYSTELRTSFIGLPLDPGVGFIAESGRVLWVLGYPDQARERVHKALVIARSTNHPESIGFAELFAAFLHQFFDEPEEALRHADYVLALSAERDVATTLAWGMVLHGWALGATGRLAQGIDEIRQSLSLQRGAGAEIARPQFAWMLGDLLLRTGKHAEAHAAADDGLSTAARTKDHYWDSELLRLKGEILVDSGGSLDEADKLFRDALEDARLRKAKSLELRAAMSVARLLAQDGRAEEGRVLLRPIYDWFSEGHTTGDLVAAKQLLTP